MKAHERSNSMSSRDESIKHVPRNRNNGANNTQPAKFIIPDTQESQILTVRSTARSSTQLQKKTKAPILTAQVGTTSAALTSPRITSPPLTPPRLTPPPPPPSTKVHQSQAHQSQALTLQQVLKSQKYQADTLKKVMVSIEQV